MKRDMIIPIIIILTVAAIVTIYNIVNQKEEGPQAMIPMEKYHYPGEMEFEFQIVIDGQKSVKSGGVVHVIINPYHREFNPFYTDIILVGSEEQAQGFPDNIIVAWPTLPFTQFALDGLNLVSGENFTIEEFLEDPNIGYEAFQNLTSHEREDLGRYIINAIRDFHESEFLKSQDPQTQPDPDN